MPKNFAKLEWEMRLAGRLWNYVLHITNKQCTFQKKKIKYFLSWCINIKMLLSKVIFFLQHKIKKQ